MNRKQPLPPLASPGYSQRHARIINLLEQNKYEDALLEARLLQKQIPDDAEANHLLARALVQVDDKRSALKFAETAARTSPENPGYSFFLGRLYLDFHLFEYAEPHLSKAFSISPRSMLINWALGDLYFLSGRGLQALPYYESALRAKLNPHQTHRLKNDYADCLVAIGRLEDAERILVELRHEKQSWLEATIKMADLKKYGADSEIGRELEKKLLQKDLDNDARSEVHLSLGRLYENSRSYDTAFVHWVKSRALKGCKFDATQNWSHVTTLKTFYTRALFENAREFGNPSTVPTFVVGMPRSGTTLTEQIIAAHPDATGVGELSRMLRLEGPFRNDYSDENGKDRLLSNAAKGELRWRGDETLKLLRGITPSGKKRIVDKSPVNFAAAGYIHMCYPHAKIIHCRRHPADNFISAFQNRLNEKHDYSYDQKAYIEYYLAQDVLMSYWKSCFPANIFTLQYESLVAKPETTVREMIAFLGLPWDPNCLKFFEQQATVRTFSHRQVRNPIYNSSVGRWRNYEKHLGPLFAAMREANFNYPEAYAQAG